jgi:hypothetical protein
MSKSIADLIETRFGTPTNIGTQMPAEGALASILERRTHRQYTDQVIEEELLEVLIACGLSASSKSGLQRPLDFWFSAPITAEFVSQQRCVTSHFLTTMLINL